MFGPILWIVGIVCAIWVIYDVLTQKKKMSSEKKLIWVIAAIIFSVITAIVYLLVEKNKK